MSRLAESGTAAELAARALVVGMLANTAFKLAVALALGAPRFRRDCGLGLAALGALLAGALVAAGGLS
jgi:hypothetical protein